MPPNHKPAAIFKPTLILHGGAGSLHRSTLPPDVHAKYHASLLSYLRSTKALLENGATALDAAVHAVSLMEDDKLFNCGRGSVFTSKGTIEMEASVMVTSVLGEDKVTHSKESMKRGAGVIGLKNVRHPIHLAKEVLVRTGEDENGDLIDGDGGRMLHSQLAGPYVEELARGWRLEFKPDEWFWTEQRWKEHLKGMEKTRQTISEADEVGIGFPSQGTVGCVCLDQWGNLAVATSTGGLTNKLPGRVGDTPTLGAGFWAETWEVEVPDSNFLAMRQYESMRYLSQTRNPPVAHGQESLCDMTPAMCLSGLFGDAPDSDVNDPPFYTDEKPKPHRFHKKRRAVAVSGTGDGDGFLRTAAARTTCAMTRFSDNPVSLEKAVTAVAGANGELQRSAGRRFGKTPEGQGGIIGIEAEIDDHIKGGSRLSRGKVVFDFNCGGMWRAWVGEDEEGRDVEQVMVFREPYH
ncbi:nucleophile aminohydrolase [Aspergillus unguis]